MLISCYKQVKKYIHKNDQELTVEMKCWGPVCDQSHIPCKQFDPSLTEQGERDVLTLLILPVEQEDVIC